MSRQSEIFSLIQHLTGQKNILTVPRAFIAYTGSLEAALLLSQIIYWSDRTKNPQGWFYKSYLDWQAELSLSKHKVNTAVNQIKSKGILKTKVKKANGNPTLHYRFDANAFIASFSVFLTKESEKIELTSNRDYIHEDNIFEQQKWQRGERGNVDDTPSQEIGV